MVPYLVSFSLGHFHLNVPSYGVFLALGFSAAYIDAVVKAKRVHADPKHVEKLFVLLVFGAIAGSRLFHVLFEEFDYYLNHPLKIFAVWEGGYTFYGAVLFCTLVLFLYGKSKKVNFLTYADLAAGGTSIGLFLGRIGCFLAGCCWGKPTTKPWGVTFSNPQSFCPIRDHALHPTQLYEAAGALVIYLYLTWLVRRRRYDGQLLFHSLVIYSIMRFAIEMFRGDDSRGYVFGVSYSQVVSLCILPFALLAIWKNRPQRRKA